jgi:hypothetical protein
VGERVEGLFPALDDGAFDESGWWVVLGGGFVAVFGAGSLSSMSRIASQSSLITASSLGKWPRFLMVLRSW